MPSSPTAPPPEEPGAGASRAHRPRTPGPLGTAAAALLRVLRPRGRRAPRKHRRTTRREAALRHRLTLDLDDCRQQRDRWQRHADSYERELTVVSLERAHLLAWVAALHPASAVVVPAAGPGPAGTHQLRLVVGRRPLSWRLRPADLALFTHVRHAEPTTAPAEGDVHRPLDQAAHIRRHTRLLAIEATLFTAPAATGGRTRVHSGDR
ncbi:hypothetical protein ABZT03_41365 [Streptomyces sp. NPDC005574]|uniref:hypothetical protein n=1 Tax=Streptomyces sp. NPDC005574 TaxID=3156891 RepID=UPI0033B2EE9F